MNKLKDAGEQLMILMNQLKGSDIQNESNPIFRMMKGLIADSINVSPKNMSGIAMYS